MFELLFTIKVFDLDCMYSSVTNDADSLYEPALFNSFSGCLHKYKQTTFVSNDNKNEVLVLRAKV